MKREVAYIESGAAGQSRRRAPVLAGALIASFALAGCSISFSPMSLFGDGDEPATTGSVSPKQPTPLSRELSAEDWRRAQAALAVALDPQGNGQSASWDNPETKMKGSFSPVGAPFVKDDEVCRAFLATTVVRSGQEWAQGVACKPSGGEWAVREAKPWKKPA